jgi:hypothetical protein
VGAGRPAFKPGQWNRPGQGKFDKGKFGQGKFGRDGRRDRDGRRGRNRGYHFHGNAYVWGPNYGLSAYGTQAGLYYGPVFGYMGGVDFDNLKYLNVTELAGGVGGTVYRQRMYYDRLDRKNFAPALDNLAAGVLGSVMVWSQRPLIVAHSAALEKLFIHLDRKIKVRLADRPELSESRQLAEAFRIVRDTIGPLVEGISVNDGEYVVRFKTSNGGRSPWVVVPVVYGLGNVIPRSGQDGYGPNSGYFEGFSDQGVFEPAGPFYYQGPNSGASLEPAKLGYNPDNLYWKD